MQDIINNYLKYIETDKLLFKEFLNDILLIHNCYLDNRNKKTINQGNIDNIIEKAGEMFKKEGFTEDDFKNIKEENLYNEIFGITDIKKESIIILPIYKGNKENAQNDNLFIKRIDILEYLEKEGIIKISKFNLIKEFHNTKKDIFTKKLFLELKEDISNRYGKLIVNRQLNGLKGKEKYIQTIIFKKKKITKLLQLIKESEIKEFKFKDGALFYGGKVVYVPRKNSDRKIFLNLLFSKAKGTYFSMREIFNEIEGEGFRITDKEAKRIYNLKRTLNKLIKGKTGINNLFSFGKGGNEGKICINY